MFPEVYKLSSVVHKDGWNWNFYRMRRSHTLSYPALIDTDSNYL